MNIFVLHVLSAVAASKHCDKHANKMILETTQMLMSVLRIVGIPVSILGLPDHYKTSKGHRSHPCTLWTLASQAHAYWLLDLGLSLCKLKVDLFGTKHACMEYLMAMKRTRCFDTLPSTSNPTAWATQLLQLGFSADNLKECLSRVASVNPPSGCTFGVVCVPESIKNEVVVFVGDKVDLVATYSNYMVYKAKRHMVFKWNRGNKPPDDYGTLFSDVLPKEPMLETQSDVKIIKEAEELRKKSTKVRKQSTKVQSNASKKQKLGD